MHFFRVKCIFTWRSFLPIFGFMLFGRVCSENQTLSKSLEEKTKEMQTLKTENTCE